jgi:anti-sigma factor RsiW
MMDHAEAARKLAVEQYLLGELSEAEREEFELHFFSCSECAETVESGAALLANARAVLSEERAFGLRPVASRKRWWSFETRWGLAAALAGWAVAVILGADQFLRKPGESSLLTVAPAISVRAVRSEQVLTFSRQQGIISFAVAHEWEEKYSGYQAEIERAADHRVIVSGRMADGAPESAPLAVSIRPDGLKAGSYFLVLYGLREGSAERNSVERIAFTLTE